MGKPMRIRERSSTFVFECSVTSDKTINPSLICMFEFRITGLKYESYIDVKSMKHKSKKDILDTEQQDY